MIFGKSKRLKEYEQIEAELKAQLNTAKKAADELSELAAQELRTPLIKLQKLLSASLENPVKAEELKVVIQTALNEIASYKSVIDDLHIISRTDTYKEPNLFVPINLTEAVREVAERFRPEAEKKHIVFNTELEETFSHPAHPAYIRKMISLLLDNAVKYTPEKGTIRISLKREKNHLILLIEDTGYGMEPEEISKALKRFHRLERSRREGIAGFGLGLSIAQWIARLHGTDLDVSSMTDKGTKFQIRFPLHN